MKKKETRKKSSALVKSNENGAEQSYTAWIADLKRRYRATQIKATIAVNSALIEFYWNLGKDISEKYPGKKRDARFFHKLSMDLQCEIPDATGLSVTNIKYARYFFELYSAMPYRPQVVDDSEDRVHRPHVVDDKNWKSLQLADENCHVIVQHVVAQLVSVPWGHHRTIIDKCKGDREKALFYVRRTIQNGWSRNSLSTDLYEREGKAQNNFELTMPSDDCDLARQIVKDPQNFEVFGLREKYSETELKAAIVANIESTLLSFGKGVAFLGKEYPVEVGCETKEERFFVFTPSKLKMVAVGHAMSDVNVALLKLETQRLNIPLLRIWSRGRSRPEP